MRIFFEGMSSWTPLTMYLGIDILDQIYIKQTCPDFYYDDFIYSKHYTKMHTNIELSLKPNFMSSFL